MKRFLAVLSILAFLFIAGPVSANWIDDLPLTSNVVSIEVDFGPDGTGIPVGRITLKTNTGDCKEYYIEYEEITHVRDCGGEWKTFTKHN